MPAAGRRVGGAAVTNGSSAGYVHAEVSSVMAAATDGGGIRARFPSRICGPRDVDGVPSAHPFAFFCGDARFTQCAMSKTNRGSSVRTNPSGGAPSIARHKSKRLPPGRGCILWNRFGRSEPVWLTESGELLTIRRRPSDVGRQCNHCSPRHSTKNLNCFAATGVSVSALPAGSLVDATTGDVIQLGR